MSERGVRRGAGAPFYAAPTRKTSAEIISEARAAIYGENMSSASSGSGSGVGVAVRPLRTRRPFTPREPQRTLFSDRAKKKEGRPPSAFDLKYLTLSENSDDVLVAAGTRVAGYENEGNGYLTTDTQTYGRKKPMLQPKSRSVQDRSGDGWSGFPKLPHLTGHSKPLHRRNTINDKFDDSRVSFELSQSISVTRPLGSSHGDYYPEAGIDNHANKSLSVDAGSKRNQYTVKSLSFDASDGLGEIPVKHLAVTLPNTAFVGIDSMSLLELAEALSQKTRNNERTVQLMDAIQSLLQKNVPANSLKELVLRSLYTHIDSDDERILVAIARAMLTLRVTGSHLAAACKLVFKIARNDKNDHFFRNTNLLELLVEGCGRADPLTEGECCVYGAGALRFLALEPTLCAKAHQAGALHLAALHLKILNNAKAENPRHVSEQANHALYQVTGALRNLAGGGAGGVGAGGGVEAKAFVSSGALHELLNALLHHTDRDILTNVARCLSVVSAEAWCCEALCAEAGGAGAVLRALRACGVRAPLAVRLAYTLGNMAAASDHARQNIYDEDGGVDTLLTILESYSKRNDQEFRETDSDADLHLVGTDLGGSDGSNEDVLIKTVRVVANLCLTERAGRGLADTYAERTVNALLSCLELAEKPVSTSDELSEEERASVTERREELATAALATLNNITFYRDWDLPDPIDKICSATCRWLRGRGAAGCEAVRALGNLSRSVTAAQRLVLHGALDQLAPFLHHEESNVRCAAAGVLVNVCGAGAGGGAARLAGAALARAAAAADTHTAALLARALWNARAHRPLSAAPASRAAAALSMLLDDESVFTACEASRGSDRRASDPELSQHHVKLDLTNPQEDKDFKNKPFVKAYSVEQELHLDYSDEDGDRTGFSGEDLGFEEGELVDDGCECAPCRRLAAWEELVAVAIPLLEKLRPPRADASVGTE